MIAIRCEFRAQNAVTNPLERLLKKLIRGYSSDRDLLRKLEALFEVLDESGDGGLACEVGACCSAH